MRFYIFRHNRGSEIEAPPKCYGGYFALDILQKCYICTDFYSILSYYMLIVYSVYTYNIRMLNFS